MKQRTFVILIAVVMMLGIGHSISFAKAKDFWKLEFQNETPTNILIKDPIQGETRYWYFTYAVTNSSDQERNFSLRIVLETEDNDKYEALVHSLVQKRIERKLEDEFLDIQAMRGTIAPGETKKGIAVFRAIPKIADTFVLWVSGLTNAYAGNLDRAPDKLKYKVLRIEYIRKGDEYERHLDVLDDVNTTWEMK